MKETEPTANQPADIDERYARLVRESAKVAYRQDDTGDDSVPEDMDLFRLALCRRITFIGVPQRCRDGVCRRSKRCMGPTMRCRRDFPPRKVSPERDAAAMAAVYRAVKQRAAALEAK